ncbi:MAG: acyl carrier protein [Pseudomonadota bacterium]
MPNERSDIFDKFKQIIIDQWKVPSEIVLESSNFADDLGANSLDMIDLRLATEAEFVFPISDNDAAGLRTVGEAIDYLHGRTN